MRIIYDISVLGQGFYDPRARTGIFRVVENLGQELARAKIDCTFSAELGLIDYFRCEDYLLAHKELQGIPLAERKLNKNILRILRYCYQTTLSKKERGILFRIWRRLVSEVSNRLPVSKGMNPGVLTAAEIYHSPYYPFPEQVTMAGNLKRVITVYDLIPVLYPKFFGNQTHRLLHQVLESIDKDVWVTCISHSTKHDLCNYLPALDPDRVFVTHLAASSLFFQCLDQKEIANVKRNLGIPEGPYVLSLSTLEPRKNIIQTIRCFATMVEESGIDNLSLVLVGAKGWDYAPIFDEISIRGNIRDRIIVTGYVADEDLAPLYSGAMMFVYPSFYEGFGLPPLEAMQCGVPVITSNTSSLPEVVGNAGIMVGPEDKDGLCQAMLKIYSSEEIRRDMSARSLVQASKFSWAKCAEQTIDAYRAAIAG